MPRLRAIAKPSLPSHVTLHQPASHSPTSTSVPFGIRPSVSLLVPGAARRLVSAVIVTGLAAAAALKAASMAALNIRRDSGMADLVGSIRRDSGRDCDFFVPDFAVRL